MIVRIGYLIFMLNWMMLFCLDIYVMFVRRDFENFKSNSFMFF